MTKIFLPTEIGIKGEGSSAGIRDIHTPDVHEVLPWEDPAVKEQPEFYKHAHEVIDLTIAEQLAHPDNTRNQTDFDLSPKEGDADPAREPVELGELGNNEEQIQTKDLPAVTKNNNAKPAPAKPAPNKEAE